MTLYHNRHRLFLGAWSAAFAMTLITLRRSVLGRDLVASLTAGEWLLVAGIAAWAIVFGVVAGVIPSPLD